MATRKPELVELQSVDASKMEWEGTPSPLAAVKVLMFRDDVLVRLHKFEPGIYEIPHKHGFWQLRYILDGEFILNEQTFGPGTLVDFPENTIYEIKSVTGGSWLSIQLKGPNTGIAPSDPYGFSYDFQKNRDPESRRLRDQ
jgi:hypothetical protein